MIYNKIEDVPAEKWEKLAKRKIYFGHQSVGFNLVDGLQALIIEYPQIGIHIAELTDPGTLIEGQFSHSAIGKNKYPETKIEDFVSTLNNAKDKNIDSAFLKFCYVDVVESTNMIDIFTKYKQAMQELKSKYPDVTFIHFTVPLRTNNDSLKAKIRSLLGMEVWGVTDNIKRNQYNQLITQEYGDKGYLFDIAKYESTLPDGTRQTFRKDGKEYFALNPGYSNDGGHLNELGAKYLAEKLLLFLVSVLT